MKTIWKYELQHKDRFTIELPLLSRPLAVDLQQGIPVVWAEVQPDLAKVSYEFFMVGTGHPISFECADYIGTFQEGPFVWHIYYKAPAIQLKGE